MAAREERLSGATRNYVIFALLLVVALALAARERFGPHSGTGVPDSAIRLMVVGGSPGTAEQLDEVDGFSVWHLGHAEAIASGRVALDDDGEQQAAYAAAIAHADQHGYGFIALARHDSHGAVIDWQLDEALPDAVPFVVFSVGDLAPEGPRMRWFEPAPLRHDPPLAELDSVRLALYDHPDLLALWQTDPAVVQLQAREVLRKRGIDERREQISADQARWRELADIWPTVGVIPGSLAGPWEQVRAAPIRGGVLVEVRSVEPQVSIYRKPRLSIGADAWLFFVPRSALSDDDPDETKARQRCENLPERISGDIAIAPDGSSLVLRESEGAPAQVFVFDASAAESGRCVAQLRTSLPPGERPLGRSNGAGAMTWSYAVDRIEHVTPGSGQRHVVEIPGAHAYSGPWWIDESVLALIGEPPLPPEVSPSLDGVQPSVFLLDTITPEAAPWALDARALFGLPPGATVGDAEALIELRPAGERELLVLTERCADETLAHARPCLHRLHSEVPWRERMLAPADQLAPVRVEALGPLGPFDELAIASDGSRAVWIDREQQLLVTELRGPGPLSSRPVHGDELHDAAPRIAADGQLVTSSVTLALDELGSVSISRAFVLPPSGD